MAQKLTKKEALMAIITALRDDNNEVFVETVDSTATASCDSTAACCDSTKVAE